jgi:hypothetical protein
MERLACHGFIVVAPDHVGDTLFDRLDGTESPLNNELVDVREADIRFLARISAVVGLAAPMENILYGEVSVEAIEVPLGLLVATEDNSITEAGNFFIRENFSKANAPAYKIELVDAGHWSVTNIAGLGLRFASS